MPSSEDSPRAHLRIEKNYGLDVDPTRPHVVRYDRVMAVGADGTEVEISNCVTEWREIAAIGEARHVEIRLFGVVTQEGEVKLIAPPEAEVR